MRGYIYLLVACVCLSSGIAFGSPENFWRILIFVVSIAFGILFLGKAVGTLTEGNR